MPHSHNDSDDDHHEDGHDHEGHDEHDHGHHHSGLGHSHAPANFGSAFAIGTALNLGFVVVQVVFGLFAHSLALLVILRQVRA